LEGSSGTTSAYGCDASDHRPKDKWNFITIGIYFQFNPTLKQTTGKARGIFSFSEVNQQKKGGAKLPLFTIRF
jgi:hypothetical protein